MPPTSPEIDETARKDWVERILAASRPADVLLAALEELDAKQDIATQAALFESVLWRAEVRHYWVYFRMARVYAELAREEASFQMAAQAARLHPEWDASHAPFQIMFRFFARRGDARAALDVFLRQLGYHPEKPVAERREVEPLLRALGVDSLARPEPSAPALPASHPLHRVAEAEARPATPVRTAGGAVPQGLVRLGGPMQRAAIDVAELADGELLICNDSVVVRAADGTIEADLSVGDFPELVAGRVLQPADGEVAEQHAVEQAVLILDAFPPPNLCHFLFDQIARLELYRRAGADLARALVVGPELRTEYQRLIAARAGIAHSLGTARLARVRARRLWVSTDCKALQHPAHWGSGWAVEHARAVLGGRGNKGHRRLYISRADLQTRRVQNEPELITAIARFGFDAIVPGAMPYEEQLAAFRAASHVIGTHGAALSHIILCPPGARVLELFHPLYGSWDYAMLSAASDLDYTALVARDCLSDAPELNDPARIDMAAARFGERNLRVDAEAVVRWMQAPS